MLRNQLGWLALGGCCKHLPGAFLYSVVTKHYMSVFHPVKMSRAIECARTLAIVARCRAKQAGQNMEEMGDSDTTRGSYNVSRVTHLFIFKALSIEVKWFR